ncbi:hypothetical protein [Neptuniibacter sp. QD37_11]|uniref:hypothetical protein n=1 Tax=Neptuniibacter sp. QD37_11 TaxID=3398209 RepID=UPI0039F46829
MEDLSINLSKDEKSLLVELTDFGKSLPELISEIHSDSPALSLVEKYTLAINTVTSLVSKDLVLLCELDCSSTKPYSANTANSIPLSELSSFLNDPYNWSVSTSRDGKKSYELAPTDLGEELLDQIFGISSSN